MPNIKIFKLYPTAKGSFTRFKAKRLNDTYYKVRAYSQKQAMALCKEGIKTNPIFKVGILEFIDKPQKDWDEWEKSQSKKTYKQ